MKCLLANCVICLTKQGKLCTNNLPEPTTYTLFYIFIELTLDPPEGIVAGPVSEDNFFEWEALIA